MISSTITGITRRQIQVDLFDVQFNLLLFSYFWKQFLRRTKRNKMNANPMNNLHRIRAIVNRVVLLVIVESKTTCSLSPAFWMMEKRYDRIKFACYRHSQESLENIKIDWLKKFAFWQRRTFSFTLPVLSLILFSASKMWLTSDSDFLFNTFFSCMLP